MFYITGLYRQWSDGQGIVVVTPTPAAPSTGAGPLKKKKRYIIAGRDLELTDDELQQVLASMLVREPEEAAEERLQKPERPRKRRITKVRDEPAKPETPTFAAVPAFDVLWQQKWVRSQPEIMAELRRIAHEIELARDDEEVELLLL